MPVEILRGVDEAEELHHAGNSSQVSQKRARCGDEHQSGAERVMPRNLGGDVAADLAGGEDARLEHRTLPRKEQEVAFDPPKAEQPDRGRDRRERQSHGREPPLGR